MRLDNAGSVASGAIGDVWRSLPTPLRRLLLSDVFIRTCDAMVDVFLVLYAVNVVGIGAPGFGVLIGLQMATVILCSLPTARLADRLSRKPFIIATFVAFTCFPLAIVAAHSFGGLVIAFVVGGLREIGEPARKRAAATIGGLLWKITPGLPFLMAGAIGLVGTTVFALTVHERRHFVSTV